MDVPYFRLLKNTRETDSQLNKYSHSALTLQHHTLFPHFAFI